MLCLLGDPVSRYTNPLSHLIVSLSLSLWGRGAVKWSVHGPLDPGGEGTTFETSVTTNPVTQCRIPEDPNPQKQCCENLKSYTIAVAVIFN
jgi:hypothetical protein